MVNEIKQEPESFVSLIQVEIAMSAEKRASREISITGENIGRSEMFTKLQNMNLAHGERLLTSNDLSSLAQEIVSSVVASDITTGAYIEKPDQVNFAHLLEHQLSKESVNTKQLTSGQWKSVFWREEFTRPDRYTKHLNNSMTYDAGENKFKYDTETESEARRHVASDITRDNSHSSSWSAQASASFLGFGGSAGGSSSSTNTEHNQDKNEFDSDDKNRVQMSLDQLDSFLKKRELQVEWNGEVFVPKSLDLHRINIADLRSRSKIATQQVQVQTVPITVKLDATVATYREPNSMPKEHVQILIDQAKTELTESFQHLFDVKVNRINEYLVHMETKFQDKLSENLKGINVATVLSKIEQIQANIQSLQHPQIKCHTVVTDCLTGQNKYDIKCNEGHYIHEWHAEVCDNPRLRNLIRFHIVCCTSVA